MSTIEKKPELIAPAGNFDKLHFAITYGADAVYFGGNEFNLRVKTQNFDREELAKAVDLCSANNVKTIFLMNAFLHESDLNTVKAFINEIKDFTFSAIMISDPGMLLLLQEEGISIPLHLSTQVSTLNHKAVNFWHNQGINRIVLGREVTLNEIKVIKEYSDCEIEVFIHGAVCISYSGRCLLSR